jgi:hypothetical protein
MPSISALKDPLAFAVMLPPAYDPLASAFKGCDLREAQYEAEADWRL